MRQPKHRRVNPSQLCVGPPPEGTDLAGVAGRARYVGSEYHKDLPSFAGQAIRPLPDREVCPRDLAHRQADIQHWLEEAIQRRQFSPYWEGGFPRYVWHREGEVVYAARLINRGTGEYKGFPLLPNEKVKGLP